MASTISATDFLKKDNSLKNQLALSHINNFFGTLFEMENPDIFQQKFYIFVAPISDNRGFIGTPYVFISKTDPTDPNEKKDLFQYSMIGVGHPSIPWLDIRPFCKYKRIAQNNKFMNSELLLCCHKYEVGGYNIPYNGTLHAFLNEFSINFDREIKMEHLKKYYGKLTDVFLGFHLSIQLPSVECLDGTKKLTHVYVQSYTGNRFERKKVTRSLERCEKHHYISERTLYTNHKTPVNNNDIINLTNGISLYRCSPNCELEGYLANNKTMLRILNYVY